MTELKPERLVAVKGFPNHRVSDHGNVYGTYLGKLMTAKMSWSYLVVCISLNKKQYTKVIHRIVAEHFVKKPIGKDFVNHIDGNKLNNHYSNLEWCTRQENADHAWRTGLYKRETQQGANNPRSKLTEKQILKIRKLYSEGVSIKKIAPDFGICPEYVRQIGQKKAWRHL